MPCGASRTASGEGGWQGSASDPLHAPRAAQAASGVTRTGAGILLDGVGEARDHPGVAVVGKQVADADRARPGWKRPSAWRARSHSSSFGGKVDTQQACIGDPISQTRFLCEPLERYRLWYS